MMKFFINLTKCKTMNNNIDQILTNDNKQKTEVALDGATCHHADSTRQPDGTWKCPCGETWNHSEFWMRDMCGCGKDKPATWVMCGACDKRIYD